jgi:hypothetical protein
LHTLENPKEASPIFDQITEKQANDAYAWYGKARLVLQHNETEALNLLEKALSLNEELKIAAKQDQGFNVLQSN